jgi:hypothetical protein
LIGRRALSAIFQDQNATRMLEVGCMFVTVACDTLDQSVDDFIALTI